VNTASRTPETVQDRLIAAAHLRFSKFGFRRTGVADIARDAGLAAGTVYRYFDDKEALFRAVIHKEHDLWYEIAQGVLAGPGSASERLSELARASVQFHQQHALSSSILENDTEMIQPQLLDELQQAVVDRTVKSMAEVIRQGIRMGEFREVDAERTARVFFLCGRSLFRSGGDDYPELLRVFTDLTRIGLRRPAEA